MSDDLDYNFIGDGISVHSNLNTYMNAGIKDLHITVEGVEFVFTKAEIFKTLVSLKQEKL